MSYQQSPSETPTPTATKPYTQAKYHPPTAYVGCPVQWFPNANRQARPQAGQIVALQFGSSVTVHVQPETGKARRYTGCPHIDDPALPRNTDEIRRNRGAWDFIPGLVPYQKPREPDTGEERQIVALFKAGNKAVAIAAELGEPWTHQKVNGVLQRMDLL